MKINLKKANLSLINIFENSDQIITIDANFLIPPDRSRYARRRFDFPLFKKVWIDPIFTTFPNLAIHEAVYDELVGMELREYIESLRQEIPPKLLFILIRPLQKLKDFFGIQLKPRFIPIQITTLKLTIRMIGER